MSTSSGYVMSVLGPVEPAALGYTLAHEHLAAHPPRWLVADQPDLDLSDSHRVLVDLERFRAAGGGSIVEMTTADYGRDIEALAMLSRESGVRVIAATGFNKDIYSQQLIGSTPAEQISAVQIREIRLGVEGSGICPGVVKFATGSGGASAADRTAAEAAALTHIATGCPILTHTEAGQHAMLQLELMREAGVPATAVTVGHMDRNPDFGLHREIVSAGAFVSYDSVPKRKYDTERSSIELIVRLAAEGLHTQVVVSGDFARQGLFEGYGGSPGLSYIPTVFAERLREAATVSGLDGQAIVEAVLRTNPARALTFRRPLF